MIVNLLASAAMAAPVQLTASDAVQRALLENPDVDSADLSAAIAHIDARRARLDRFTASIDATSGASLAWADPPDLSASTTDLLSWDARATASVPLFAGGAIDASIDAADAGAKSADLDVADTQRRLVRAVLFAYWTAVGVDTRIAAAVESLDATRKSHAIVEGRVGAGLAAGIDLNRSQVGLLGEEAAVLGLSREAFGARQDLLALLHAPPSTELLLADTIAPSSFRLDADALVQAALQARPDLGALNAAIDGAAARRKVAAAGFYPSVTADAAAGVGASSSGGTVDAGFGPVDQGTVTADELRPTPDASIGLSLHWNPFDLWQTADQVRQGRYAEDRAQLGLKSAERQVESEVRSAVNRLETLRSEEVLVQRQVDLARRNNQIVQDLYSLGSATLLDLLDAQASFRDAVTRSVNHRLDLVLAEVELADAVSAPLPGAAP